jgi:Cobalt uptake substrate-specific transmembrane region
MASEKLATSASGYDHFTSGPWITVLCLWVIAVLPPIFFGAGGILPSPWLVLSILVIPVATVVGLILLIVDLFRLRWRAATSIVFASVAFALATFGSLKFSDELRRYTLRPYYVHRIEGSLEGPYNIHGVEWDGGNGWDVTLEYHETETDARAWQQKQQEWLGSCKRTLKEIAPHYFLNGVYC